MAALLSHTLAGKQAGPHEKEQAGNAQPEMRRNHDKFLLQVIVFAGKPLFLNGNVDNGFIGAGKPAEAARALRIHGDSIAMSTTPSAIVLVVASTFAAFAVVPCRAAESGRKPDASAVKRSDMRNAGKTQVGKSRRNDKEATRRIVTYNLFQDPVFKLNGALADKRQLGVPPVFDRLSLAPKAVETPANATALKLPEPESAGIDFGCSDKPFRSSAKTRELTACYKHNVDRSWKTQTYLSREYSTEGNQKWGGGLAVRYAY